MHDRDKKRFAARKRAGGADSTLRRKIATEAARRLYSALAPKAGSTHLGEASEAAYYAAKRAAAAVLGQRVRPGDLPSDSEVREQVLALVRSNAEVPVLEDVPDDPVRDLADHVDRFTIYKMRLEPLESVKQDPIRHPEGDALYHSLQVFERARDVRPYDEEFLLAALLHDVGKAIDPKTRASAGLESLRGAIPERTAWLIEHHRRPVPDRVRRALADPHWLEDLQLLDELDAAGRVPGAAVETLDEALEYLRRLDDESFLEDTDEVSS